MRKILFSPPDITEAEDVYKRQKRDRKRGITVAHNTRDRGEYHRADRSMEAGRTEAKSRQPKESEESKTAVDDRSGRNVCFRKDNAGR